MVNDALRFHHFGLAVKKAEIGAKYLQALGYAVGEAVFDPIQNVHLAMGTHESEPAVEVIWPASNTGPVDGMVQRHTAGIIYHVCYETSDLEGALAGLREAGLKVICISPPYPAPLFGGRKVSFYNVVGMGLIEILE
jgi:methylmalonyl-CoA/ethylmalonyl-CoA epimerase